MWLNTEKLHKILQLSPLISNYIASDKSTLTLLWFWVMIKTDWTWLKTMQWIEFSSINLTTLRQKKKKRKKNRRRQLNNFWILIGIQKIDLNCINEITLPHYILRLHEKEVLLLYWSRFLNGEKLMWKPVE